MTHPRTKASRALRALILEKAATPQGYGACDARHLPNYKNAARVSTLMVCAGLLHKAHVPTYRPRYFATAAAAAHYITTTPPRSYEECQAIYGARYAAKRKTAIRKSTTDKPKPSKPKAAKPPPEVKVVRPDYTKPAAVQKPKVTAVIVWPERMPPCRLMPPPRNQVITHSFVHLGYGAMRA